MEKITKEEVLDNATTLKRIEDRIGSYKPRELLDILILIERFNMDELKERLCEEETAEELINQIS